MLNITFVIVLLADIALAADSRTLGSIIASRQVTAQSLRQGTKRTQLNISESCRLNDLLGLSARQNAPSLAPTLALSPYTVRHPSCIGVEQSADVNISNAQISFDLIVKSLRRSSSTQQREQADKTR